MKIAFSTLGCPEWPWNNILAAAADLGYDGIEIRGIEHEMLAMHSRPFLPENRAETMSRLKELGLEISCFSSPCSLVHASEEDRNEAIQIVEEYIELAAAASVPYVRVLIECTPDPTEDTDLSQTIEPLRALATKAGEMGVTILIETNASLASSQAMKAYLEAVNHPHVGVIWDIHHPYRYFGESAEQTYAALRPYIRYVHMKDSVMTDDGLRYKMVGAGDNPNQAAISLLLQDGFDGFVSLEWVKRWNLSLEEPGIVFPQFISAMRTMIAAAQSSEGKK